MPNQLVTEVEALRPLVSLAGYEGLRLPAAVLLDNVRSMYNVGAFFRAADGVGLEKVCLCGITARPPKKAITKTALGAEEAVPWQHDWDAIAMAESLRSGGFQIAAIETDVQAVDLFDWQPKFPVCVAFGHEVDGLSPELLEIADTHVRIPMLGKKKSLNVATAAGVVFLRIATQISDSDRFLPRELTGISSGLCVESSAGKQTNEKCDFRNQHYVRWVL
jgi:23S rRNA (guanosine2251-2'-O)-methyltransferase